MPQGLMLGVVVATYPAGQSVDVLLTDDGSRLSNVQVLVPTGSSDTGEVDLPDIGLPADDTRWDIKLAAERYVRAVVGFIRGAPVVIGFLLPQITQLTFDQKNRRIMRHASGAYSTIDGQGNTEFYHPSGAYVRIAASGAHEDLSGKDVDGKWKAGGGSPAHIHIEQAAGTAAVDIAPDGSITVNTNSTVTATAAGAVYVKAPSVTLDTPNTTCTGNLTVDGGLSVMGTGGAASAMHGNLAIDGGTLTHNSKNVGSTHEHSGVQTGSGNTGAPI